VTRAARQAAIFEAKAAALDRIEEIERTEGPDRDFRRLDGYLIAASDDHVALVERAMEACREIGISGVAWDVSPVAISAEPRCLRFPDQARFRPLNYLGGLIRCIRRPAFPKKAARHRGDPVVDRRIHGDHRSLGLDDVPTLFLDPHGRSDGKAASRIAPHFAAEMASALGWVDFRRAAAGCGPAPPASQPFPKSEVDRATSTLPCRRAC
jgi:hypothetical protein